jgi:hypothetical protein
MTWAPRIIPVGTFKDVGNRSILTATDDLAPLLIDAT